MISKLGHEERFVFDFINYSMFIIDSPGSIAGKTMFKWFRFSDPLERRVLDVFDKLIYSLQDLFISSLPVEVIFPGVLREDQIHSTRSLSVPAPDANSAMDSRSRRAFFGLRSR